MDPDDKNGKYNRSLRVGQEREKEGDDVNPDRH